MPSSPYWIKDAGIVLTSTDIPNPPHDFWGPLKLTKVIIYNTDSKQVKNKIKDFISFSNFLNQNYSLYSWIVGKSFTKIEEYALELDNLKEYIANTHYKTDWFQSIKFGEYPLLELTQNPTKINFREQFLKYLSLRNKPGDPQKIKKLIEFFAFNNCISVVHHNIYENSNFQISNSFLILESLINLENKKDRSTFDTCINCGYKKKVSKSTIQLMDEYLTSKIHDKKSLELFTLILKEHYKVRNGFFHNAKYDDYGQKTTEMINQLGRNHFNIYDEIKYANASSSGLIIVNTLIRILLLDLLKKCST